MFTRSCFVYFCLHVALFATTTRSQNSMSIELVSFEFDRPVYATHAPGEPDRLFVAEQHTGNIRILDLQTGLTNATPFLTVTGISTGGEQGLLGLAFHPNYAANGRFFVYSTTPDNQKLVEEYTRATPDVANPAPTTILQLTQKSSPFHNGGWLGFGPDGFLYVSVGDGDFPNNGQDITDNLLGKILRIDIDGDDFVADANRNYAIPNSNPFVGMSGEDEIFAYGLRNPWRCSFDRSTGDLYIGDVGDDEWEEIDILFADSHGGENFGWDIREGANGGSGSDLIDPIYDYAHGFGPTEGFAVTGGYVYRGPISDIQGHYFFIDFVTNRLWSFQFDGTQDPSTFDGNNITNFIDWADDISIDVGGNLSSISSFAEDSVGNLYLVNLAGGIYRITDAVMDNDVLLGDINLDEVVNLLDVSPFVSLIGSGDFQLEGDINMDGVVNLLDVSPFIDVLSGG